MIYIGEKLNSSIPATHALIVARDAGAIASLAVRQVQAGAEWLDLNAGMFTEAEGETLAWLAAIAADATDAGLVLDSPDPAVLDRVAAGQAGRRLLLNSATMDPGRLEPMTGLALRLGAGLVVLPIRGRRMPATAEEQEATGDALVAALRMAGLPDERIYLDILVGAAAAEAEAPARSLRFARTMRSRYPAIHLTGGFSNVSYGLPGRHVINAAFASAAICAGVDAPILDVLNRGLMHQIAAAALISGQDEYCAGYLDYYRSNMRKDGQDPGGPA